MSVYKNYNKYKDYQDEINRAAARGDYAAAEEAERYRNAKIDGEGLTGVQKTYNYIDVGNELRNAIKQKEPASKVKELVGIRRAKAVNNKQYNIYKNDEIQRDGVRYYRSEESGAGYGYGKRPKKQNSFENKIQSLINRITNQKKFSYDPEEDEVYLKLRDQMQNESRRAAIDTAALMQTEGGGKNSYAATAAMQAASTYNAKLAEALPKLYEQAYDRFSNEQEAEREKLESVLRAAQNEEDVYQNRLRQFNTDREFSEETSNSDIEGMDREDEHAFEEKKFNYEKLQDEKKAEDAAKEAALKLVQRYEEEGLDAPLNLLELAGLSEYEELNKNVSGYYRNLKNINLLLKQKQAQNYDASISQKYNSIVNANSKNELDWAKRSDSLEKFEYQKYMDSKKKKDKTSKND